MDAELLDTVIPHYGSTKNFAFYSSCDAGILWNVV